MRERLDVCLVGTSNAENLGAVARLLANFGLGPPLVVAPRAALDDPRALVTGRAALDLLEGARTAATLEEAVRAHSYVVGFSARRGADRPVIGLAGLDAFLAARAPTGRIALVFGPEDTGLARADVDRCDVVVAIDTPGPLASFNLAQAVAITLWELGRAAARPAAVRGGATREALEGLLDHAFEALDAIGYLRGEEAAHKRVHLRRVLGASALTADEVQGLRGLCAAVLRVARPAG